MSSVAITEDVKTQQEEAAEILKKSFVGSEENHEFFGIETKQKSVFPFSTDDLWNMRQNQKGLFFLDKRLRFGHLATALSRRRLCIQQPSILSGGFPNYFNREILKGISKEKGGVWIVADLSGSAYHFESTYDEHAEWAGKQSAILPSVPLALFVIVSYYLKTGNMLFSDDLIRCADRVKNGEGADLNFTTGWFNSGSVKIFTFPVKKKSPDVGASCIRVL